ncbi:hypothetical protein HAX54_032089 [Datura stramonium]|uniref:Uncharacterized protein n=1 Tax=Datura stramonium TaxID=4076 RepID=A0ABS8SCI7_DATST|nr:hypothetical protein [Datura stramonium]
MAITIISGEVLYSNVDKPANAQIVAKEEMNINDAQGDDSCENRVVENMVEVIPPQKPTLNPILPFPQRVMKRNIDASVHGGLDGHCSSYRNSYSPSPSPYYAPPVVFDAYKNNEEEEHHAQMSDMEKLILEHMEETREKLTRTRKSLRKDKSEAHRDNG